LILGANVSSISPVVVSNRNSRGWVSSGVPKSLLRILVNVPPTMTFGPALAML
jgi:hypothetical protein